MPVSASAAASGAACVTFFSLECLNVCVLVCSWYSMHGKTHKHEHGHR